ncbi:MAG: hypothetical protein V3U78_07630 [Thiotrichaceae bacterium]
MNNKKHNVAIGLASLLVSIPAPTFIHKHFNTLIAEDSVSILGSVVYGFEAQMLLIMMIATSIGLFAIALYELGGYLITMGNYQDTSRLLD